MNPEEGGATNWRRYIAAVYRYKWLIALVTVLGTAGGVFATKFLTPTYTAQATVWVESKAGGSGGPIRSAQLLGSDAWLELLKSFVVLDTVVRELRLHVTPAVPADSAVFTDFVLGDRIHPGSYRLAVGADGRRFSLRTAEGLTLQEGAVGDTIGEPAGFRWTPPSRALTAGRTIGFQLVTPREAAVRLRQALVPRIDRTGNFIRVELTGTVPPVIASTLNALVEHYVEVAAQLKRDKLTEITRTLEDQLAYAQQRLAEAERTLENFRVTTITMPSESSTPLAPGLAATQGPVMSNFFAMKVQLDQLSRDREMLERLIAQIPDSGVSVDGFISVQAVQGSAQLSGVLQTLSQKQAELRSLRYRYTDSVPLVQRAEDELQFMTGQTVPQVGGALVAELRTREADLRARIAASATDLQEIPARSIEEGRLRRAVVSAEGLAQNLLNRYEEARLTEASAVPDIQVLDRAVAPRQPLNNSGPRLIAMALVGSLAVAVLLAILLDRIDRKLRYPDQVTVDLGLPILGAVPRVKFSNGNGRNGTDAAPVLEALRGVRLSLVHAYGAAGPLLVTITSPGSGDGKSFMTSNLALAFADVGHRTLVIDGDVRRGELHRLLGTKRQPGLTDYLAGDADRGAIVQTTRYTGLHFIGGGRRRHAAPELLSSGGMAELLVGLRGNYSVILIDSPPMGAGVDPFVLGTATGNLLLVLRTGVTDRELAEAHLDALDRLPIRILGAVLNDVRPTGAYRYYGYQYNIEGYEAVEEPESAAARLPKVGS